MLKVYSLTQLLSVVQGAAPHKFFLVFFSLFSLSSSIPSRPQHRRLKSYHSVPEGPWRHPEHNKGPQTILAFLIQDIYIMWPIHFAIKINMQVFVSWRSLNLQALNVYWCKLYHLAEEVSHHCLAGVYSKTVFFAHHSVKLVITSLYSKLSPSDIYPTTTTVHVVSEVQFVKD